MIRHFAKFRFNLQCGSMDIRQDQGVRIQVSMAVFCYRHKRRNLSATNHDRHVSHGSFNKAREQGLISRGPGRNYAFQDVIVSYSHAIGVSVASFLQNGSYCLRDLHRNWVHPVSFNQEDHLVVNVVAINGANRVAVAITSVLLALRCCVTNAFARIRTKTSHVGEATELFIWGRRQLRAVRHRYARYVATASRRAVSGVVFRWLDSHGGNVHYQ